MRLDVQFDEMKPTKFVVYSDKTRMKKVTVDKMVLKDADDMFFNCFMDVHAHWRSYLLTLMMGSNMFCCRMALWLIKTFDRGKCIGQRLALCQHCSLTFKCLSHLPNARIKLHMMSTENTFHNIEPEIKWSVRILPQVFYHLQLEAVFAWLSTLGGAHSALGDHFDKNAETAWYLSVKQLQISLMIGDPVLAAHCQIFMSISLSQRNQFLKASNILRMVKKEIVINKRLQENKLINCYIAAKVRLKYLQQSHKFTNGTKLEVLPER